LQVNTESSSAILCYHCGDVCPDGSLYINEKKFCCAGCKTVYEILNANELCSYYSINENPGIQPKYLGKRYDYLDDEPTEKKLIDFKDDSLTSVTFFIPQIHCSSCIWLLENLYKINQGVISSQTNFLKKELNVKFRHNDISLKELVKLLASLGYEPQISLDSIEKKRERGNNKRIYMKLGVAAFAFGNIMLMSFPEYLSIDVTDTFYKILFGYLNMLLALPVLLYSSSDYFKSAVGGLRRKVVNLDVPIALGIIMLFGRSSYEVLTQTGAGYFDSLAGLLFFLLIGKLFQSKTYEMLNFERDYKAYFPLSVTVKEENVEKSIPVSKLKVGDRIIIHSNEIIPADAILFQGNGNIDYSFVTGESKPVEKVLGEVIYAGGKQIGSALELEVVKEVSQSYLTQLWNSDSFKKQGDLNFTHFSNIISKYFTIIILAIAFIGALFWLPNLNMAFNVFTAVLIIACPCALAMSTPFTLGNTLRIFGRNRLYMKSTAAIKEMSKIKKIVLDKTGTITKGGEADIIFEGIGLNDVQKGMIKSLVRNSIHPLSRKIYESVDSDEVFKIDDYKEATGKGIEGRMFGHTVKLGSKEFVSPKVFVAEEKKSNGATDSRVYLSFDDRYSGYFRISNVYREGIKRTILDLKKNYKLTLLSGDNEGEKEALTSIFGGEENMKFKQSPADKLDYIKKIQEGGDKVVMVGDGLNDAGALSQSDVGIAVTDDISNFSPACDAILDAGELNKLPQFIQFASTSVRIIYAAFIISFLYNIVGLSVAVQGLLSPIFAAIIMPLSSISVIVFATVTTNFIAKRRGLLCL
jgi:P-type Cu+ transporter